MFFFLNERYIPKQPQNLGFECVKFPQMTYWPLGATMSTAIQAATKFYIAKPSDEYWNTSHPKEVIQVEESPLGLYGERRLKVLNSADFAKKWPSVSSRFFIECTGPARKLDYNGYVHLVHSLLPNKKLPDDCEISSDHKE